jgi:hypothetical protein
MYNRIFSQFSVVPVGAMTRNASISTATTLTIPSRANGLFLQGETSDVYYTLDGSTPSTTNGFILQSGELIRLDLFTGAAVKVISATGAVRYQAFGVNTNG